MEVRACESKDIAAICAIYNHFIKNTTITFEEETLSEVDMQVRVESYQKIYPWLVGCHQGSVVGYTYATRWKERIAYRHTAEATIYVKAGAAGNGYGKALYSALLESLCKTGCHVVLGCIALPNEASVGLHESFGFRKVAHFCEVGRKFGQWLDVGYWELQLPSLSAHIPEDSLGAAVILPVPG
ncbi:MAG: N-acetyltransferase [Chlorobium sp.]|jgi:phosphinothricin acetyltransferase|nr:N-acetyltransferase [Chlorobium sp.]